MISLARSPLAIEIDEPLFLCHAQGLTGVVVTPKELCLFSVLKSHPMKRNSRVSQHLLQGCMSWSNCIHTNYLFFTSSSTSYMMATSKPTYLLNLSIEVYPLSELCRTGTSYMNPNSWRRKPVTFIWLFKNERSSKLSISDLSDWFTQTLIGFLVYAMYGY